MPSATAFSLIPFPSPGDPIANGDDIMAAIAERVDYLVGETIVTTITPSAANTKTTKVIAFGRTYKTAPRCIVGAGRQGTLQTFGAGGVSLWVDDVSTTTVTIAIHAAATTVRDVTIMVRPLRTDVTP